MVLDLMTTPNAEQAELDSLATLLVEFDTENDARKIDYLKHRYAGFTRREAATLAGVTLTTTNKWLKLDTRVAHFDHLVTTDKRKSLKKDVLQEEWGRNFYMVMKKDSYILRKSLGMLEERVFSIDMHGKQTSRMGSPVMQKEDWDYFHHMRKTYTPEAWNAIEKAMAGQVNTFNIAEFIINQAQTQQVNLNAS